MKSTKWYVANYTGKANWQFICTPRVLVFELTLANLASKDVHDSLNICKGIYLSINNSQDPCTHSIMVMHPQLFKLSPSKKEEGIQSPQNIMGETRFKGRNRRLSTNPCFLGKERVSWRESEKREERQNKTECVSLGESFTLLWFGGSTSGRPSVGKQTHGTRTAPNKVITEIN